MRLGERVVSWVAFGVGFVEGRLERYEERRAVRNAGEMIEALDRIITAKRGAEVVLPDETEWSDSQFGMCELCEDVAAVSVAGFCEECGDAPDDGPCLTDRQQRQAAPRLLTRPRCLMRRVPTWSLRLPQSGRHSLIGSLSLPTRPLRRPTLKTPACPLGTAGAREVSVVSRRSHDPTGEVLLLLALSMLGLVVVLVALSTVGLGPLGH